MISPIDMIGTKKKKNQDSILETKSKNPYVLVIKKLLCEAYSRLGKET